MPVIFVVIARLSMPQLAQILCSPNKLSLDPRFPAPEAVSANPPACFSLRNRSTSRRAHARGTLAAQIPIAERAARPTEPTPAISCLGAFRTPAAAARG
jgi:hypothetical protein